MRAGSLDHIATLRRDIGTARDAYGVPISNWVDLATVRVSVVRAEALDKQSAGGWQAEATLILRMRWMGDLTTFDRMTVDNLELGIVSITELGRRRGLEVVARRLAP